MRKLLGVILLLSLLLAATGCSEFVEVDETAFVFALTVDKAERSQLKVGVRIPVPRLIGKVEGGPGGGTGPSQELYLDTSVEAPSILEAINMLQVSVGRVISMEHVRAIIISDAVAREGVDQIIRTLMRNPELRSTTLVYVTHGSAFRLVQENNPLLEINTAKYLELMTRLEKVHGFTLSMQLGDFYADLASDGVAAAPVIALNETVLSARKQKEREKAGGPTASDTAAEKDRQAKEEAVKPPRKGETKPLIRTPGSYMAGELPREGGNAPEFSGIAIFNAGKLVGMLDGNAALAYNILTGHFQAARVTFSDPHTKAISTARIYQGRPPHIRLEIAGDKPKIQAQLVLDADYEFVETEKPEEFLRSIPELETAIAAQVKRWVMATVKDTQKWSADVFGFSRHARRHFLTWGAWQRFDWAKAYKQAEVDVTVSVNIRRPGLIFGPTLLNK